MRLPDIPTQGKPISAAWGRDLILYLKSREIQSSPTVRVSDRGPGGQSLTTIPGRGTGSAIGVKLAAWTMLKRGGLGVGMVNGILSSSNDAGVPTIQSVAMADVTVTDNATTYFWLETDVEAVALGAYLYVWKVTSASMVSGTALPDPMVTADFSDPINGYGEANFHIGTAVASGGEVDVSNLITGVFPTIYPMGILLGPFDCSDIGGS